MQTIGQPPRGFAPTGAGKETMEEIKELHKRGGDGRRPTNLRPPSHDPARGREIRSHLRRGEEMASSVQGGKRASAEQRGLLQAGGSCGGEGGHRRAGLHDEGPADRRGDKGEGGRRASKKWYTVKGGGVEKAFFSLEGASLK